VSAAGPLRGPGKGGGFAAAGLVAPAKGTGPPPRPQGCCASRWRATALRAALDPGDPCGPWEQGKRAGPGLPPPGAGATRPARPGRNHHNRSLHGLRGIPPGLAYSDDRAALWRMAVLLYACSCMIGAINAAAIIEEGFFFEARAGVHARCGNRTRRSDSCGSLESCHCVRLRRPGGERFRCCELSERRRHWRWRLVRGTDGLHTKTCERQWVTLGRCRGAGARRLRSRRSRAILPGSGSSPIPGCRRSAGSGRAG
jgi:hypothetical protein